MKNSSSNRNSVNADLKDPNQANFDLIPEKSGSSLELREAENSLSTSVLMGRLSIVAAAVLWSTSGFFAKAPIFDNWPLEARPYLLTFWRAIFASAFLLLFVRQVTWNWRLVPMVLSFAAMSLTYMSSMVYAEATLAIWLQYTAPIWVLLGGVFFFGESTRKIDLIFLAVALSGVAWIIISQLKNPSNIGLWFGMLAGFFFALVILQLRLLRGINAVWLVFVNQAVSAIAAVPFVSRHAEFMMPQNEQWLYLIAFGALQMGLPYLLFARGLKTVLGHEASGLLLLEPILVPLWVFIAWHHSVTYQAPHWSTWVGATLILASLVIRYGYEFHRYRCRSRLIRESKAR